MFGRLVFSGRAGALEIKQPAGRPHLPRSLIAGEQSPLVRAHRSLPPKELADAGLQTEPA
jgi:hypothetical protein